MQAVIDAMAPGHYQPRLPAFPPLHDSMIPLVRYVNCGILRNIDARWVIQLVVPVALAIATGHSHTLGGARGPLLDTLVASVRDVERPVARHEDVSSFLELRWSVPNLGATRNHGGHPIRIPLHTGATLVDEVHSSIATYEERPRGIDGQSPIAHNLADAVMDPDDTAVLPVEDIEIPRGIYGDVCNLIEVIDAVQSAPRSDHDAARARRRPELPLQHAALLTAIDDEEVAIVDMHSPRLQLFLGGLRLSLGRHSTASDGAAEICPPVREGVAEFRHTRGHRTLHLPVLLLRSAVALHGVGGQPCHNHTGKPCEAFSATESLQRGHREQGETNHLEERRSGIVPARLGAVPVHHCGEHLLLVLHTEIVASKEGDHAVQRPRAELLRLHAVREVLEDVALQHFVEFVHEEDLAIHDEGGAKLRRHMLH
mmetsp:Transcript_122942/g.262327  ORF Transcript_122942/g.262327 Transcript_122942/m.262327 type:complete len:427 (-) Transcript_122942:123-1403(-)